MCILKERNQFRERDKFEVNTLKVTLEEGVGFGGNVLEVTSLEGWSLGSDTI